MKFTYLAAALAAVGLAALNAHAGWQLPASQAEDALGNYIVSALILAVAVSLGRRALAKPEPQPSAKPHARLPVATNDGLGGETMPARL